MLRRLAWFSLALVMLLVLAVIGSGFYLRRQLNASLPILEGSLTLAGLEAEVRVARDSLGVPTIVAASRRDAAAALGFLHAQDRFFQMDLQRRQAAGELSALVGARAVPLDRTARVHRFRHISQKALSRTGPGYRALLESYANGVNAGLAALRSAPIEYHVLNVVPEPWKPEDTLLTGFAMFNTLQGRQPLFEATFGTLADTLPAPMYEFLTARGSEWDTPLNGATFPRPAVPSKEVFDLVTDESRKHRNTEAIKEKSQTNSVIPCFRGSAVSRTRKLPVSAATTGRSMASTRPAVWRSSPTICTWRLVYRISGTAHRSRSRARRRICARNKPSPGSPFQASPASSSAATVTWRGDSPTRGATGAISS